MGLHWLVSIWFVVSCGLAFWSQDATAQPRCVTTDELRACLDNGTDLGECGRPCSEVFPYVIDPDHGGIMISPRALEPYDPPATNFEFSPETFPSYQVPETDEQFRITPGLEYWAPSPGDLMLQPGMGGLGR